MSDSELPPWQQEFLQKLAKLQDIPWELELVVPMIAPPIRRRVPGQTMPQCPLSATINRGMYAIRELYEIYPEDTKRLTITNTADGNTWSHHFDLKLRAALMEVCGLAEPCPIPELQASRVRHPINRGEAPEKMVGQGEKDVADPV